MRLLKQVPPPGSQAHQVDHGVEAGQRQHPLAIAGLVIATATLCGLSGWAALGSLTGTGGLAVFWPVGGIATGLALGLGRERHAAVAAGAFAGIAMVHLAFGRDPGISLGLAGLSAAEAVAIARLLEAAADRQYSFQRLMHVLAFFGVSALVATSAGLGAALLLGSSLAGTLPWIAVWRTWVLADFVGIAVLAPFLVAAIDFRRSPVMIHDWRLDVALLLIFAMLGYHALSQRHDDGTWMSIAPVVTLLPLLIWLSARAQPIVPALAVLLLAGLMAGLASEGIGRYGDARLPAESRIAAAGLALSAISIAALSISALYTERRNAELHLKASELRLAAIAETAPGVIFSLERHPKGEIRFTFVSAAAVEVLGVSPQTLMQDPNAVLARLEPSDRTGLLKAFDSSAPAAGSIRLELRMQREAAPEVWVELTARSVREGGGPVVWHGFIQDVTARRQMAEELGHRTRNLLGVVQAVAEHTARRTPPAQLADTLAERLSGLAASHYLLAARGWEDVPLEPLVRSQLAHLADLFGTRITIEGLHLLIRAQAAQIIGMAVHELATNSLKHGSLGSPKGSVRLLWGIGRDRDDRFEMRWEETGGPAYIPGRRGFGSKVVLDMAGLQLGADVALEGRPDGLLWKLSAPTDHVVQKLPDRTVDPVTALGEVAAKKPLQRSIVKNDDQSATKLEM